MPSLRRFRIKAYVIHCVGNKKREPTAKKLVRDLKKLGISASIFPCINYKKEWLKKDGTPNATFQRLYKNKVIEPNHGMSIVEYAISLSHKLAVQKFEKTSSFEYGIVFEDDVTLHVDFAENLARMLDAIRESKVRRVRNFALFYLWNTNAAHTRSKQRKVKGIPDVYEEVVDHNAGGPAYLFRRKFAEKERKNAYPIMDTADAHNGYCAFERYKRSMAFLTVKMTNRKLRKCDRALPRIIRDKWYDDPCITSPLVHTPWYDDTSSHGTVPLEHWEHFDKLRNSRIKGGIPKRYTL